MYRFFFFAYNWSLQSRAGIDGGGVFKEFLTSLCMEVFDSDRGLWLATKKNELYPNPHSYATERQRRFPFRRICFLTFISQHTVWLGIALSEGYLGKHFMKASLLTLPLQASFWQRLVSEA